MEMHNMIALSTAHITAGTFNALAVNAVDALCSYPKKFGFDTIGVFVALPDTIDEEALPEDLRDVIPYALENGADWIMFNSDVLATRKLPVYTALADEDFERGDDEGEEPTDDNEDEKPIVERAKTLPEGWNWTMWPDGSGSLSAKGIDWAIRYDRAPYANAGWTEYQVSNKGWELFEDSFAEFCDFAEMKARMAIANREARSC